MQCLIPVMERTHLQIIAGEDPQGEKSSQDGLSKHDRVDRLAENQVPAHFCFEFSIPGHDPSADMGIHCDVQGKGQKVSTQGKESEPGRRLERQPPFACRLSTTPEIGRKIPLSINMVI